ncbi:hypothetical protein [Streptomyces cinereoruber]|uniref:hypothetical protein n=1 Tax=Streptomyces cinereoruber TaxID=67260 RepID=UPI003640501C
MTLDLTAARAFALRHPENRRHAELLAAADPEWAAARSRPLDLTAARAAIAARRVVDEERQEQRPAPPPPPTPAAAPARPVSRRPLDVAAARARRATPRPIPPVTALRFLGRDSTWRWVSIETDTAGARRWERLTTGLVAAGPFQSLRMRGARMATGPGTGESRFHRDEDGAEWVDIVLDDRYAPRLERLVAHELGHVADEIAQLEASTTATAWRRDFTNRHRCADAEAFAIASEEWVRPTTTAAELLAAARRHRDQRGRRG